MLKESKQLAFNSSQIHGESLLPQVRIEDIPTKRRKSLRRKRLFQVTEDEFEEWLAVTLNDEQQSYVYDGNEDKPKELSERTEIAKTYLQSHAQYLRAEYRHIKRFALWEQVHLQPLVKELASLAKHDPQFDWHYLYKLERQKLICMEAYLSHSRVSDAEGNYIGKLWLCKCITLLDYILQEKEIGREQIDRMNLRNAKGLVDRKTIQELQEAQHSHEEEDFCQACFDARKIYRRKMERLYHLIRLQYTRYWWE